MPLGFYLGQGLIPLVEHSSDDEEGPCTLPDGRVVCGPHGLVVCGKCCTAYDFEEVFPQHESDKEMDYDDDIINLESMLDKLRIKVVKGTGRVFPTRYKPRATFQDPMDLFSGRRSYLSINR
jgi:ribonuclease HI